MHHSVPLVPAPEQSAELPAPDFQERGIQLLRFIHLLVNFGTILLQLEQPSQVAAWRNVASALVQQPAFTDAIDGLLDEAKH